MDKYIRKPLKHTLDDLFEESEFSGYSIYYDEYERTTKVVLNFRDGGFNRPRRSNINARFRRLNRNQSRRDTNRSRVRFQRFNDAASDRALNPNANTFTPCPTVDNVVPSTDVSQAKTSPSPPVPPVLSAPLKPDPVPAATLSSSVTPAVPVTPTVLMKEPVEADKPAPVKPTSPPEVAVTTKLMEVSHVPVAPSTPVAPCPPYA